MKVTGAVMKILAFMCLVHLAAGARKWDDLRFRFDILKSLGFHKIPTSSSHPLIKDYVKVEPEADFNLPLDFYCQPDDPRACIMLDRKGNVAGVQTSFLKADVANVNPVDYNYTAETNFKQTDFFGIPAYSFRAYFVNPETLTESGRQNVEETADGLWVYLDGQLIQIPREQPKEERFGDFYKQGCLRSMGQHYFYKTDKHITDCSKGFALFPLYEDGSLVGYGLATYGKGSRGPKREWYEHPPWLALSIITPNRPECMDKMVLKYGLTSMHVYLVDKPWDIPCNFFDKIINWATDWIPF